MCDGGGGGGQNTLTWQIPFITDWAGGGRVNMTTASSQHRKPPPRSSHAVRWMDIYATYCRVEALPLFFFLFLSREDKLCRYAEYVQ